ncbi:MAG: hypothetical protein QNJ72_39940 [Pleurocapsa sp. MO_226.B13]|nr:hypothetical protein [Pleurocapsa sp. MO_226.B13]
MDSNRGKILSYSTVQQIWQIIEQTQTYHLLELNDSELLEQVSQQLETNLRLNADELNLARNYIQSKISLIRDLADSRLAAA